MESQGVGSHGGYKTQAIVSEMMEKIIVLPLLLLSRFRRVRLCATPEMAAHQAPPWDSPGKNTGVGCHFSNAWKWKVKVKSLSHAQLLATPSTAAHQASPFMGFSRQGYWSGVPLPSPKITLLTGKSSMGRLKSIHGVLINKRSLVTLVKSISEEEWWLKACYVVFRRQSEGNVNLVCLSNMWLWPLMRGMAKILTYSDFCNRISMRGDIQSI